MASAVAERSGNPWLQVFSLEQRVALLRASDQADEAEEVAHQALTMATEHRFWPDVTQCLELLAGLAIAGESWAEGVRLAASADSWRTEHGCQRWPVDERRLIRARRAVERAIGILREPDDSDVD